MKMQLDITGTSALIMHSARGIDPDDELVREIAIINKKGARMTPDDRMQKARLQWRLSIYEDEKRLVLPTANIRRCIQEGAKSRKLGTAVLRAISMDAMFTPLIYPGPTALKDLIDDPTYRFTTAVGIGQSRVITTRPKFPVWSVSTSFHLLHDVLDPADVADVVAIAGRSEGLCDARKLGYGRFTAIMKEVVDE